MTRIFRTELFFFAVLMLVTSCKEKYEPEVEDSQSNYLVVEGVLNNGGITTIKLSRTRPLNDGIEKPELKALVSVQSENSDTYPLTEKDRGEYTIQLNLNSGVKYRLRIKTATGKEYLSDFVPVKNTPPIDEVTWKKNDNGLLISVNARDPQNNTRYYRWGYEETWIRQLDMKSYYEYVNGAVHARDVPPPTTCYDTYSANPLSLASTAKLTEDVVSNAPVHSVPLGSTKLVTKYSILVKQYALEKKAHEYWQAMKKNTEQLGSIFDPQPSYMYGNIRSVNDPKEMVIGYFSACNVTEKRIFITAAEANWTVPKPPVGTLPATQPCKIQEITDFDASKHPALFARHFGNNSGQLGLTILNEIWYYDLIKDVYIFIGYSAVENLDCADCGPNYVKPVWWE